MVLSLRLEVRAVHFALLIGVWGDSLTSMARYFKLLLALLVVLVHSRHLFWWLGFDFIFNMTWLFSSGAYRRSWTHLRRSRRGLGLQRTWLWDIVGVTMTDVDKSLILSRGNRRSSVEHQTLFTPALVRMRL